MAIFKCKMCGGTIEFNPGDTVGVCDSCGTKQTLPHLDDEKRIQLYDRANHFRRNNEFDKAMGIYESILAEDKEDAEAYWSLILCRYGIEYVEDPATHKRVPTVNRAQYTSVFIDEDYQSALKYADGYQRDIYEAEAKAIDEIQKGILEISNNEDPFDVFICYKETDHKGERTSDSVYAQEVYDALTNEGYKVFFSRITLEDKLGTEYEPYIFAALHSAPVMVVIGTSAENLNSAWVKNEWSRYLALIKSGEEKTLVPVYKNMDPYDLPEEFSYLQAQDMNKVGFMQDLIRGVKKIVSQDVVDERQKKGTSSVIVDTMTRRGSEAIANGDWDTAIRCYDSILDYDSKNIDALIGKLKAVKQVQNLEDSATLLETDKNYKKIIQFADEEIKESVEKANQIILDRLNAHKARKNKIIRSILIAAIIVLLGIITAVSYNPIIKPAIDYSKASIMLSKGDYENAINAFTELGDYRKSKDKISECYYDMGLDLINQKKYEDAIEAFGKSTVDSTEQKNICWYELGTIALENKEYDNAEKWFNACKDYKDAASKLEEVKKAKEKIAEEEKAKKYKEANDEFDNKNYGQALSIYESLGDYKESKSKLKETKYQIVKKEINENGKNTWDIYTEESDFYKYFKELRKDKYKDIETLYNKTISYSAEIYISNSQGWMTVDSQVGNPFYVSIDVSCNAIDDDYSLKCKAKITYGDGTSEYTSFENSTSLSVTSGPGTFKVTVYDPNGNVIDSASTTVIA